MILQEKTATSSALQRRETGEPEAAPSPHRDLRDTPDPRPCPARAPKMTTTLVSATIFDLSEVLCKVKWGAALAFQSLFSFILKKNLQKFRSGQAGVGEEKERRDGCFFRLIFLPSLKEFGFLLPTLCVSTVPGGHYLGEPYDHLLKVQIVKHSFPIFYFTKTEVVVVLKKNHIFF